MAEATSTDFYLEDTLPVPQFLIWGKYIYLLIIYKLHTHRGIYTHKHKSDALYNSYKMLIYIWFIFKEAIQLPACYLKNSLIAS